MPASAGYEFDDLVQIGAVAAIEETSSFDPSKGATLGGWQSTHAAWAVRDEVARQIRRTGVAQMDPLPDGFDAVDADAPSVEDIVDRRLRCAAVIEAALALTGRQQQVLCQIYGEGMTLAEVAAAHDTEEAAICRSHGRIIRRLREQLAEYA